MKLCDCGCGQPAPIAKKSNSTYGHAKGQPVRFIRGHFSKTAAFRAVVAAVPVEVTARRGPANGNWKGGRYIDSAGYVVIAVNGKYVREHRVVAAQTLGRPLRVGEVVHHRNGNRDDNRPENLEVLLTHAEHMRKHMDAGTARARGQRGNDSRYGRAALLATL